MGFINTLGNSGFPDDTIRFVNELLESDEYCDKVNANTMTPDNWDAAARAVHDKSISVGELWEVTGSSSWLVKHRADRLALARDVVGSGRKCFCGRKGHEFIDCYINPKGKKPDTNKILLTLLKNSNVKLDREVKIALEDIANDRYTPSRSTHSSRGWDNNNQNRPLYGAPSATGGGGAYCYVNADKPHDNKVKAGRDCDGSAATCKGKGCKFHLRGAVMRAKMGREEYESIFRGDKYFQSSKWTSGPHKIADTVNVVGGGRDSHATPAGRDLIPSGRGNTHHL